MHRHLSVVDSCTSACAEVSRWRSRDSARRERSANWRSAGGRAGFLILAGGTDVGLWVTKQLRDLPPIIYVGEVAELKYVEDRSAAGLRIGAAVSLTDAWRANRRALSAACGTGPAVCVAARPQLRHVVRQHRQRLADRRLDAGADGARAQHRAAPRQDARAHCRSRSSISAIRRTDLQAGEFVVACTSRRRKTTRRLASYKVSKRIDQDISRCAPAFAVDDRQRDRVK